MVVGRTASRRGGRENAAGGWRKTPPAGRVRNAPRTTPAGGAAVARAAGLPRGIRRSAGIGVVVGLCLATQPPSATTTCAGCSGAPWSNQWIPGLRQIVCMYLSGGYYRSVVADVKLLENAHSAGPCHCRVAYIHSLGLLRPAERCLSYFCTGVFFFCPRRVACPTFPPVSASQSAPPPPARQPQRWPFCSGGGWSVGGSSPHPTPPRWDGRRRDGPPRASRASERAGGSRCRLSRDASSQQGERRLALRRAAPERLAAPGREPWRAAGIEGAPQEEGERGREARALVIKLFHAPHLSSLPTVDCLTPPLRLESQPEPPPSPPPPPPPPGERFQEASKLLGTHTPLLPTGETGQRKSAPPPKPITPRACRPTGSGGEGSFGS